MLKMRDDAAKGRFGPFGTTYIGEPRAGGLQQGWGTARDVVHSEDSGPENLLRLGVTDKLHAFQITLLLSPLSTLVTTAARPITATATPAKSCPSGRSPKIAQGRQNAIPTHPEAEREPLPQRKRVPVRA